MRHHLMRSRRKGQAVVEFALVAVLLTALAVVIISFADAIHMKAVADNAVREAARAAIFDYDGTGAAQVLLNQTLADNKSFSGGTCTGTITDAGGPNLLLWANTSKVVTVQCDVPLLLIGQSFLGRVSIHVQSHASFNRWNPGSVFNLSGLQ